MTILLLRGNFNFTKAAETKNAENVLVIRNNPELAQQYIKNWWFHWNQSVTPADFSKKNLNSASLAKRNSDIDLMSSLQSLFR